MHRKPAGTVYRTRHLAGSEDALSVERLPDLTPIPAARILDAEE